MEKTLILSLIIMHQICCASSRTQETVPAYNEEKVQLILKNYKNYSLKTFTEMIKSTSSSNIPLQTHVNNQEALRRRIIEDTATDELNNLYHALRVTDQTKNGDIKNVYSK